MSQFKQTGKIGNSINVSWEENDDRISEGGNKFYGKRIVGKYIGMDRIEKGKKVYTKYDIKLYADFNDESKFGQEPEGDVVTVWGTTVLDGCFERGSDGSGIKPGDIVEIVYNGKKETADKANEYHDFSVGAFTPSPSFKGTMGQTTAGASKPAAKGASSKALNDLGY